MYVLSHSTLLWMRSRTSRGFIADRRVAWALNRDPFACTLRSMSERTRDLRIESFRPLLPPLILLEEQPLSDRGSETVTRTRREIGRVLRGEDDRLVVIVGPCSIHDPVAALDYARRLKGLADEHARDLCIVMRVYFEKPRTTVGWKGLINDPLLDGSFAINEGLRRLQLRRGGRAEDHRGSRGRRLAAAAHG